MTKDKKITLPKNVKIDFGGIAKGYTSSRIMQIYKKCGVTSGLVSLGGNVQLLGAKPDGSAWKVAVEVRMKTEIILESCRQRTRRLLHRVDMRDTLKKREEISPYY